MQITINLSEDMATRLEGRMESSKFDSAEEYIKFVLDEVTTPRPEFEDIDSSASERNSEVRDQLKSLGYIE